MSREVFLLSAFASRTSLRIAETLAIGAAGGALFNMLGIPAGFLSGAIVAVALFAIIGRPVHIPDRLSRLVFVVTGITLGGGVTPETVAGMATWPLSLLALGVSMAILTTAVSSYLRFVHGWDKHTALFASTPGGLSQALVLAAEYDKDLRAIAIVQTLRVVLLALALPLGSALLGVAATPARTLVPLPAMDYLREIAILVGVAGAAAYAGYLIRLPGGMMLGAMLSSAVLHGTGLIHATLPSWVVNAGFVGIGAMTGTRFANTDMALLRRLSGAAFGAFAVGTTVAAGMAVAVSTLLSLRLSDVVLAYAPGALEAMMILSLALNADPAYVGAHHITRFMTLQVALPFIVKVMDRKKE